MSTENKLLQLLSNKKGFFVSGQLLASKLDVSRTAVWKQIQTLKHKGHTITVHRQKGYRLDQLADALDLAAITPHLTHPSLAGQIHIYPTLASTNETAKAFALQGASEPTIIIANEQTQGKGKLGKSFFSPAHTGIYISFLIRPHMSIHDATLLTAATAVAVCQAIEQVTAISPQIKWVNDLFWQNRKICGILTEASTDFEKGTTEYVIVGIGINISDTHLGFPEEIKEIAGCISPDAPPQFSRNELIAQLINSFLCTLESFPSRDVINTYRTKSLLINKRIRVSTGARVFQATVLDIDEQCRLSVQEDDGTIHALHSGDISVIGVETNA